MKSVLAAVACLVVSCTPPPDVAPATDAGSARSPLNVVPAHNAAPHVIARSDHLHLLQLSVGDSIELPADDAYDWSIVPPGPLFESVPGDGGRLRYRAIRAGGGHLVVYGDPKCFKSDGGCGTARIDWTIFLGVK